MSNLELIDQLCHLLDFAQEIIRSQAELIALHGIETEKGGLEERRAALLKQIEETI